MNHCVVRGKIELLIMELLRPDFVNLLPNLIDLVSVLPRVSQFVLAQKHNAVVDRLLIIFVHRKIIHGEATLLPSLGRQKRLEVGLIALMRLFLIQSPRNGHPISCLNELRLRIPHFPKTLGQVYFAIFDDLIIDVECLIVHFDK